MMFSDDNWPHTVRFFIFVFLMLIAVVTGDVLSDTARAAFSYDGAKISSFCLDVIKYSRFIPIIIVIFAYIYIYIDELIRFRKEIF